MFHHEGIFWPQQNIALKWCKLFIWPQFKINFTKDSTFQEEKKISLISKRQCPYTESLLLIPMVADRIRYGARIQCLKPQKLQIQFGGNMDYHFSLSQSDLRWRMHVIWRSWMWLIFTCFILLKGHLLRWS